MCKFCSDKAGYDALKAEIHHLCFSEEEASRAGDQDWWDDLRRVKKKLREYAVGSYSTWEGSVYIFTYNGGEELDPESSEFVPSNCIKDYQYCPMCGRKLTEDEN